MDAQPASSNAASIVATNLGIEVSAFGGVKPGVAPLQLSVRADAIEHEGSAIFRHLQRGILKNGAHTIGVEYAIGYKQRAHAASRLVFRCVDALVGVADLG